MYTSGTTTVVLVAKDKSLIPVWEEEIQLVLVEHVKCATDKTKVLLVPCSVISTFLEHLQQYLTISLHVCYL